MIVQIYARGLKTGRHEKASDEDQVAVVCSPAPDRISDLIESLQWVKQPVRTNPVLPQMIRTW